MGAHIKSICCLRLLKLEDCTTQKHIVTADAAAAAAVWRSVEFSTSETQCHCGGDRQELLTYLIDLIVSSNSAQRAYQYNSSSLQKSVSGE